MKVEDLIEKAQHDRHARTALRSWALSVRAEDKTEGYRLLDIINDLPELKVR